MINIIHVGKSGGSSLYSLLESHKITYKNIHNHNTSTLLSYNDDNILLLRDPVTRIMSVFNFWVKVLNDTTHVHYKPHYKRILGKNNDINVFFENMYDDNEKMKVMNNLPHFKEGLYYYCKNKENTSKINKVIRQEYLNDDIEKTFGLKNDFRVWDTSDMTKEVSEKAIMNIKKYVSSDYKVIKWLLELGLINNKYISKFK